MGEQYPRKERIKLNIVTSKPHNIGGKSMRRKHQQTLGKREYIKNNPSSYHQHIGKMHYEKVSEERNGITQNPEEIKQSIEAARNSKMVRSIAKITENVVLIALLFAIAICVFWLWKEPEDKQENVILRHYSEVLRKLDNEPEDITASPYQSNVPKVIQKDIDKMLAMGEDASIVYYNDERDQIVIEASDQGENGYKIYFREAVSPYSSMSVEELKENISFYKQGDTLVIYGGESGIRRIDRYTMNNKIMDWDRLDNYLLDTYGTDASEEEINNARYFSDNCTLTRKGSEFSLYRLGEKIYTKNFSSGEIKQWNYDYLQSADGDCYNVYYCTDLNNPWIKFAKVAENVDEILTEEDITMLDNDGYNMYFALLRIGNKKYAQLPDLEAERIYGQNYGRNRKDDDDLEVDFTTRLVEVSALSSSRVELVCKEEDYRGNRYVWYLNYYFESGDREGYIARRIKGLDSKVSEVIPPEKIGMFADKTISVDEVEEYINQLRILYDEYTDNTF